MRKSILITGNAGLLGSRMADWILENHPEYEVVGIDDLSGGYVEYISEKVVFYQLDLSKDNIKGIFDKHEFEYVYHFACYAAEGLSPFMRMFNDRNNMLSTDNIINECVMHDVKRLIYTSSNSVYGWGIKPGERFDENDTPMPIDPYGVSKYACELNIKSAGEQYGLDWCIIRPHNVYGIKQNIWDRYRNVLGIWMYQALNDQEMTIYGDGEQTRVFSYIDDCLEPFWNAATNNKASKEIINLGGIEPYTINEACKTLCNIIGYTDVIHLQARHEVMHTTPTHQKSIDLLGYSQITSLRDGLYEMWEWAKKQPMRERMKWDNYEITKGLYDYWK